jgi:hypothetical protein
VAGRLARRASAAFIPGLALSFAGSLLSLLVPLHALPVIVFFNVVTTIIGLFCALYVMRMALTKKYRDFRIALVAVEPV